MKSILASLLLSLPALSQSLSHSSVTCQQAFTTATTAVVGSDAQFTSDSFFGLAALNFPFWGPFASNASDVIGFAILTATDQGCANSFPLGPSCAALLHSMGTLIGDNDIVDVQFLTGDSLNAHWTHTTTIQVSALPPSTAPLEWVVQHVWWQTDPTECWFAAGNAIRFTAHQ